MKKNPAEINEPQKLISYWKSEKLTVILIVISGILYNVGLLLGPILQGKLVDSLIEERSIKYIIIMAAVFVLSIAMVQLFRYIKRFYVRRFANNISASMRKILYNNILYKTKQELIQENMGSVMTKAISDVDVCVEGMRKFTTEIFDTGVFVIAYIIYMLTRDVRITLASCVFVPVAILIAEKLKKLIYKYTNSFRKKLSSYTGYTYEQIDNAMLFRLYGIEEKNTDDYKKSTDSLNKSAVYAHIWENSMQPIYNVIAMIGIVFVIYLGGKNVVSGVWTVGDFVSYTGIFTALAFKASKTAKLFNSVQKATVSWKRIKPYLQNIRSTDRSLSKGTNCSSLKIENLYFKYSSEVKNDDKQNALDTIANQSSKTDIDKVMNKDDNNKTKEKYILNAIKLQAASGTKIGITGPIACGKSTFAKIFTGEYDYEGSIKIGDVELRDMTEFERSRLISYSGHNPALMSDTIYNNIAMGDEGDIDDVLKTVCLYDEIVAMEHGKNTMVGNGGIKLSGGQQARLSLARCLYRNTPVIILDDPFSAVDMKTENQIFENLIRAYNDRIIIIISHRLKIFPRLDNIIVMNNDGSYISGVHEELLNDSKLYNELYSLQTGMEVK